MTQWQRLEDASIRFRIAHDEARILIGGIVSDDQVLPERDRVYFGLDARAMELRLEEPRLGAGAYTIELRPNLEDPASSRVLVRPRRGRFDAPPETEVVVKPHAEDIHSSSPFPSRC